MSRSGLGCLVNDQLMITATKPLFTSQALRISDHYPVEVELKSISQSKAGDQHHRQFFSFLFPIIQFNQSTFLMEDGRTKTSEDRDCTAASQLSNKFIFISFLCISVMSRT